MSSHSLVSVVHRLLRTLPGAMKPMSISPMSRKAFLSAGLAALLTLAPVASSVAFAQGQGQGRPSASAVSVPITGTALNNVIAGTFNIQRFVVRQGALVAV